MMFPELYKILLNEVAFLGFRQGDPALPTFQMATNQ